MNFDYDNRIWVYNSGFDYTFMDYSPGWVLLGHLLKWANENGRKVFDFCGATRITSTASVPLTALL